MEGLGSWRFWVWWSGLLVAGAVGAYAGSHRPVRPTPGLLILGGVGSMTLAALAILPARLTPRRTAVLLAITAVVYVLVSGVLYLLQDPYSGGWGAIGG